MQSYAIFKKKSTFQNNLQKKNAKMFGDEKICATVELFNLVYNHFENSKCTHNFQ